jgi:hypothetical protein|tara:strand:- start:1266 stop:2090 length:825 start_codon:yes stop_codon:yes gene_type:complete
MRRGSKILRSSFVYLILAAVFNLSSFSLDQFVVQQEDKLREVSREMINLETKISTLINTKNSIQELAFQLIKEESLLYDALDLNTRSVAMLNDNTNLFNKKLGKNDRKELKIYFKKNLINFANRFNLKLNELKKVISSNLDNKLIKNEISIYGYSEKFEEVVNYTPNEIKISILDDYGKVGTNEYDDANYEIYNSLYDQIYKNFSISWNLEAIVLIVDEIYTKIFIKYLYVSDVYADIKNKNNFLILLSIVSQILGITFLLLLFRSLVSEKVYE